MSKEKKTSLSPWKKLALTNEEMQGMSTERLEVHLSEQVTSEMPWILAWIGRHWKKLLIFLVIIILLVGVTVLIAYLLSSKNIKFGTWLIGVIEGFGWFLRLLFIDIVGWAWILLPVFSILTIIVAKKLIKRDILAIARYGTNRIKEYALASTEEGYVIGVPRQSFFGTLILGRAKAKIDALTWEYIQQNAKNTTHKPLGEKERDYRLLYVLPEEYSNEPVFERTNQELVLNPHALIRQEDAEEIILENIGKEKGKQLANNQILYNLTIEIHKQLDNVRKLQVKVRNAPEDALQEYARTHMPETRELFFNTYNLLKDKAEDLVPFDSVEAKIEAMSAKKPAKKKTEGEEGYE